MTADSPLFEHLESGGLLIVETRETVRALRHAYDRKQQARARTAWQSPRIRTADDWLGLVWQEGRAQSGDRQILRPDAQVLRILIEIVEHDAPEGLLNIESTARSVLRSWRRMHEWHCAVGETPATPEQRAMQRWSRDLRRAQREGGWIDRARLPALLTSDLPRSVVSERIAILGFDPEPPAYARFFAACAAAGMSVERLAAAAVPSQAYRFAAANVDDELIAAASWARAVLEEDAGSQIAIVVPDLAERRAAVRSTFDRVIDPSSLLPTTVDHLPLYSMIGGDALGEHPVVDTALRALRLADVEISWTEAGQLLRSPHLRGWPQEAGARARFDRRLRSEGRVTWRPVELIRLGRAEGCESWAQNAVALQGELRAVGERLNVGAWARQMAAALRAGGWAEGRPLVSTEFQAANRFRELLAEFAGYDALLPPLTFGAARRELERLCRDTGFQAESGDPPIRILDTLDHPGPSYDGLWITGLTADRWPRPADPDPFLPIAHQRAAEMPWATSAGELAHARRAMDRLLGAAGTVVMSWPAQVDDTRSEPSALIPSGLASLVPPKQGVTFVEQIFQSGRIEVVGDAGPPVAAGTRTLRGGTRVLELQAKCPFRAFGELRLQGARLESPRPGIAPPLRGKLAHRALELLWRELMSQSQLRALAPAGRRALVDSSIRRASVELIRATSPRLLELEHGWLAKAIDALLERELERAPFQVHALESSEAHTIGGIEFRFRIDRIDAIDASAGGGDFIIDYKTGRPVKPRWLDARRDMPQLPAYAVARPGPLAGLAFAQLNLREPGFRGLAVSEQVRPAILEPRGARAFLDDAGGFEALLANWRAWTSGLVRSHVAGEARVDPVSPQTCRECALAALCRIGPDMPVDEEAADGD